MHNRIRELERFARLFTVMQTQIEYAALPTADLLKNLCDSTEFKAFSFITSVYALFQTGETLQNAWKQALLQYSLHSALRSEDILLLEAFCSVFGATDKSGQSANCTYYTSRLTALSEALQKNEKKETRLYLSFGILGGLFIAILLL